ncbi:MAG: site-specific DNA-methyltransferase [Chloroflexi bacterium]|nr:site-specific DNA-methyltransferase [Chloroflexota bacterium]
MNSAFDPTWIDNVVEIDCLEGLRLLPDCSVELIVADPPYNLDKDFGLWKERDHRDEWLPWSKEWLNECERVLKPGGSIFVHGIHHYLCWLQCHLYDIGLTYRRQIIWHYENGFSGYTKVPAAEYEPILWFSKGDSFTYHPIRVPYKSVERLRYKVKKNGKIWKPNPEGRLAGDVWSVPTLAGRRFRDEKVDHPTQKPLALSRRLVKHFSNPGELVLVPFAGSGTECVAAAESRRRFVGFETNADYVRLALNRLFEVDQRSRPYSVVSKS